MSGKWLLLTVVAILIGAVVGVISLLVDEYDLLPATESEAAQTGTAAPEQIRLSGIVIPRNVTGVPAPVEGNLETVLVSIGEEVYEGQLLGQIRNTSFEVEMEAAREDVSESEDKVYNLETTYSSARRDATQADGEALAAREAYQAAEREYLRSQSLLDKGATPRQAHEKIEQDFLAKQTRYETLREIADVADQRVRSVQSQLDLARRQLDDDEAYLEATADRLTAADVLAPVDGFLAGMSARLGDEVHPNAGDLFVIATDIFRLSVILDPEPAAAEQLRPGQAARVLIPELPAGWVEGEVVIEDGRFEVHFVSPTTAILPGSTAQVVIPVT